MAAWVAGRLSASGGAWRPHLHAACPVIFGGCACLDVGAVHVCASVSVAPGQHRGLSSQCACLLKIDSLAVQVVVSA